MAIRRIVAMVAATVVATLVFAACSSSSGNKSAPAGSTSGNGLAVTVVSSRPDMVTGGDALLDVAGGTGTPTAEAAGKALTVTPVDRWWHVSGLPNGASTISVKRGDASATVDVVDYPSTGPVFSGPHMPLLECTTKMWQLGPPTDADCSAPTKVDFLAGTAARTLVPIPNATAAGANAKYVVRRERGVINRAVYSIEVPVGTWNHRLVYRYGGGCGTSYGQGLPMTSADAPEFLALGYAVATASFNTFQVQCNDVLSAETTMMVKEHFIEENGVPVHTIGEGASGGAIQQHLIIQNYPGLLDGSVAILPFPDAMSISAGVTDCGLLDHYYTTHPLTAAQRTAINGHATPATCVLWENSFLEGVRPSDGCAATIPKSKIYDPRTNPKGLRCDLADANVNQLGRSMGFANRPLDNVGVQYGLVALQDKVITVDQFLDLNENIGGYDIDGNIVSQRERTDEAVLETVYGKGRVSMGGGDQKRIPIVDLNVYDDPVGDIHDRFRAFALRDRLGEAPNFVIWTRDSKAKGDVIGNIVSGGGGAGNSAIAIVDKWLDTGKMPAEAADNCPGQNPGADVYTKPGPCRDAYPVHGDPRTAAGEARRDDILKCALKPVDIADYGDATFTADQRARLARIFPEGVCDWTKPGVGQVPLEGTWLRY